MPKTSRSGTRAGQQKNSIFLPGAKILRIIPHTKPRMVKSDAWKKRKCVQEYWKFKDKLNLIVKPGEVQWDPLSIAFLMPMPKSWSKKKKAHMVGEPHRQDPDMDNLIKAFQDCLLREDNHVWRYGRMMKLWWTNGFIILNPPENLSEILPLSFGKDPEP